MEIIQRRVESLGRALELPAEPPAWRRSAARFLACPGHEDGLVPGGVLNGICGADGTTFNIGDPRAGDLVLSDGLPVDYPVMDMEARGWTSAHHTNEYWIPNNGWFILAAAQVESPLRGVRQSQGYRVCTDHFSFHRSVKSGSAQKRQALE